MVYNNKETGVVAVLGGCHYYTRTKGKHLCVDENGKKCPYLSKIYNSYENSYILCNACMTDFSNGYQCRDDEDSPPDYEALPLYETAEELIDLYGGYPMRIEGEDTLFFDIDDTVVLCKNAPQLMALLQWNIGIIEMHTGPRFFTKDELFYFLLLITQPWKSIEAYIEYRDKNKIPELDLGENDFRCVCSLKKVVSL
jgi:hypothetical protein